MESLSNIDFGHASMHQYNHVSIGYSKIFLINYWVNFIAFIRLHMQKSTSGIVAAS